MGAINDPANQLSIYPLALDTFPRAVDGTGPGQILDAALFNQQESALHRTQRHAQSIFRLLGIGIPQARRLVLSQVLVLGTTPATTDVVFTLTSAQLQFLGISGASAGLLRTSGTNLTAAAWRYDGAQAYRAMARATAADQVTVKVQRLNPDADLTTGTYLVKLVVLR